MNSSRSNLADYFAERLNEKQLQQLEAQYAFGIDQVISDQPARYYRKSSKLQEGTPEPQKQTLSEQTPPEQTPPEQIRPLERAEHTPQKSAITQKSSPSKPSVSSRAVNFAPMVQQAKEIAGKANTLEELRQFVSDYEGCGLKATASQLVFGEGVENPVVMVIGEGPGSEEDKQGRPFIGASGRLLRRSFELIGLAKQQNMYIANSVYWRPPADRTPTDTEVAACLPFLARQIHLLQPKLIVLSGARASQSLLGMTEGITRLRGAWYPLMDGLVEDNIPALAMFHPAYLFRNHVQKRFFWQDILRLRAKIDELGLDVPWPHEPMKSFMDDWRV